MSKIICDVCGTSYPDASSQCPICGYVNPTMADSNATEGEETTNGYTYVKGGRFSKSNVRKRVKSAPIEEIDEYGATEEYEVEAQKSNIPLIIVAAVLLVAIIGVVLFITLRFFGPWANQEVETPTEPAQIVADDTTDDGINECTKLEVSDYVVQLGEGSTYEMKVSVEPADTTDELVYESLDPSIATVDENGKITPIANGQTKIVVTCGSQKIEISVTCKVTEEVPFALDRTELTLEYEDQKAIIYSGTIPVDQITFASENEDIATFVDGVVVAVAEGETTVHAIYEGKTVSCKVVCDFDKEDEDQDDDSGVQEDETATGDDTQTGTDNEEITDRAPKATGTKGYKIKTNFGDTYVDARNPADFDTMHYIDYDITFRLVDHYGNKIDATWTVINASICKATTAGGSTFKCLKEGKAFIVATTEDGETYVCTIRVVPHP